MHSCVLKSTFGLTRSIGLPSKKVSVKWDPQSREIEKFGKGTQGKRKQRERKSDRGIMKSSHLRCELLEACSYVRSTTCLRLLQTARF